MADVAWNPDQGLHLVTASGDDKNPVIKLWDLRTSTSLPLATMQGKFWGDANEYFRYKQIQHICTLHFYH